MKRAVALSLLLALGSFLHCDPASPVDPLFEFDPKPGATAERRRAMWIEYEYMLADPWGGMTNDATRAGVLMRMDKLEAEWPEEFPR